MNKALDIIDNSDAEDECDEAGCIEIFDENKDNSAVNHKTLTHCQDYSCPFCDVKIEEKEDVTNNFESCDDANLNMADSSSTQPTCPFCQERITTEDDVLSPY